MAYQTSCVIKVKTIFEEQRILLNPYLGDKRAHTFPKYHHHHVVLVARISLALSRHFSLSFIASGRSSGQHPVSSHSCWMYVRAGRPAFARPCVGVHYNTSLMSSSLLLQQCPACLVRLTFPNIYIYIIINIETVSLYHNCSVWLDMRDAPSWDRNPLNFISGCRLNVSLGFSAYVITCRLPKCSIRSKSFVLRG